MAAPPPQKGEYNAANIEVHNASDTNDTCSSCTFSSCNRISSNDHVGRWGRIGETFVRINNAKILYLQKTRK